MHFNEGDFVTVTMARNNVFPWQTSPRFCAKIIQCPYGTGDLWHLSILLPVGMVHLAINPISSEFVSMEIHEQLKGQQ